MGSSEPLEGGVSIKISSENPCLIFFLLFLVFGLNAHTHVIH